MLNLLKSYLFLLLFSLPVSVEGHELNQSYVFFDVKDTSLSGRFEVTLEDAARTVDLDADQNGDITEEEFRARAEEVFQQLSAGLTLQVGDELHKPVFADVGFLGAGFATYGQLNFDVPTLVDVPESLMMNFVYLFDYIDPTHTTFAVIEANERTGITHNESFTSLVFKPTAGLQELSLVGQSGFKVFLDFIIYGVWHIWTGYDHIVFLTALLLPAVLSLRMPKWSPAESFETAFWRVLKNITLFTVSNSLTLTMAALGIVSLPPGLIAFLIPLSIAVVALDNIYPIFQRRIWVVVLVFGLVHGFAFADILKPLGFDPQHKFLTLLGFNIGIEIGQVVIAAIVLPILFVMRRWNLYQPLVLKFGSIILIAVALYWVSESTPELIAGFGRIAERLG
ncbi:MULTISPECIES: HupE/UreJ family protein [unclassified Ruegeria]|uniref:HupE/UreJ family protein n=1 Tax=unclassified Ruegeria TaxID=2625375 RepID=UPI00148792D0